MSAVPPNPPDPSDPPDPQGGDAGRAPGEAQPSPGPFVALGLCIAAAFATTLLFVAFAGTMDLLASRALAVVLGLGSIGALAAVHVPPPHGPRLGFRGLDSGALGATLLLIPVALLTSEVDNLVRAALGASPGFPDAPVERDVVIWLQTLVVFVGIEAILEEWFFRGVVQQGSVDRWGRLRGVLWCGLLYGLYAALGRATSNAEAIAIVAQSAALG
ncbi:MAG: hypothetical protein GWO22_16235, partial [Actinobacteria bacterium]|nr:hypothetical protein [Actinomycetota bacterium]NIT95999.1 hypothetical protein [Actinomycetota bacterium]NIV56157.1 hypothetical protein [Actinomycetota bacterium]NIV87622.1 hypothetical protein [Actinomycetota bacterium]NIX50983.1 hypothetical protein [Actinomycetota bacterium]